MMTSIARRRWLWRRHSTIRGRPRARALFVYSMTRSSVGGRNRNGQEDSVCLLVDGVWQDAWSDTANTGGRFVRKDSAFRNWLTADGAPGLSGTGGFSAPAGRYHLFVSLFSPLAPPPPIMRGLKGFVRVICDFLYFFHTTARAGTSPACAAL